MERKGDLFKALEELAQEGEVKKVWKKGPYAVEYRRSVRYIRPETAPAAEARPHIELKPKPLEVEAEPKEPSSTFSIGEITLRSSHPYRTLEKRT